MPSANDRHAIASSFHSEVGASSRAGRGVARGSAKATNDVAIAWGYPSKAHADIMLAHTNDSLGGAPFNGEGGSGKGSFCVDHDGEAHLSISALSAQGAIANGELLEYAVAVAGRAETPSETEARRANDAARADASASTMEHNIFMSEQRTHGAAFATGCARCRKQGGTREQFETCAQAMGMDQRGRVLCSPPVR
jgi:hypothetical protein